MARTFAGTGTGAGPSRMAKLILAYFTPEVRPGCLLQAGHRTGVSGVVWPVCRTGAGDRLAGSAADRRALPRRPVSADAAPGYTLWQFIIGPDPAQNVSIRAPGPAAFANLASHVINGASSNSARETYAASYTVRLCRSSQMRGRRKSCEYRMIPILGRSSIAVCAASVLTMRCRTRRRNTLATSKSSKCGA